jgi:integrase
VPPAEHHRHLSESELGAFWRSVERQGAHFATIASTKLLMYSMCRQSEVLRARWREFDLEKGQWDLPAERMKMKQPHRVYPLITNDRSLTPAQVLTAHKGQPRIEKRFEQLKTVHEIAPMFPKNETRIEALFTLYFLALLVQALIERELRQAMQAVHIEQLPLYPEARACRRPITEHILRLFSLAERVTVFAGADIVRVFPPQLTELQRQVLGLLGVPATAYAGRT